MAVYIGVDLQVRTQCWVDTADDPAPRRPASRGAQPSFAARAKTLHRSRPAAIRGSSSRLRLLSRVCH